VISVYVLVGPRSDRPRSSPSFLNPSLRKPVFNSVELDTCLCFQYRPCWLPGCCHTEPISLGLHSQWIMQRDQVSPAPAVLKKINTRSDRGHYKAPSNGLTSRLPAFQRHGIPEMHAESNSVRPCGTVVGWGTTVKAEGRGFDFRHWIFQLN
jgi:hypothetical protein